VFSITITSWPKTEIVLNKIMATAHEINLVNFLIILNFWLIIIVIH